MKRRELIKYLGATALILPNLKLQAAESKNKSKAKAVEAKSKISLISPGSSVTSPDDIKKAFEVLDKLNLSGKLTKNVLNGSGYKTRSIQERIDDIHEAFSDPETIGVFCLRGGYGSASLLDKIDYDLISKNPKIFCGYSDITALHIAINKMTGLSTFHSPVMISPFAGFSLPYFKSAIYGDYVGIELINKSNLNFRDPKAHHTIVSGKSKGILTGGNLSLISSLMGTSFELDTDEKLLFIEDVGESPYKIHRMLTQLRLAGKLDKLKGLIIGKCNDCENNGSTTWDQSEMEVYYEFFEKVNYPVFYGLLAGHTSEQMTIVLGIEYELDSDNGMLRALENSTL